MHPEVVSDKPGVCPKCGMALEPRAALGAETEGESSHTRNLRRRFLVCLVLTVPVMALSMLDMVPAFHGMLAPRLNALLQAVLTAPVVLWGAIPFYYSAWAGLKAHSTNMYTLISIGVGAAFLFSIAVLVAPQTFAPSAHGMLPVYFDTAAVITTLILLGEWLQLVARGRTSQAIRRLAGLQAHSAHVVRDGQEIEVPLVNLRLDDLLRIKPGEKIPADGVVVEGSALADEAMITGESAPVRKTAGDAVIGATTISGGTLLVRATKLGKDTLLAQIIRLVGEAQTSRAPVQKLADRISAIFVPAVMAVAVITFAAWSLWGPDPRALHALVNAVAVLIIACPCALGLATPMAVTTAVGRGAQMGILIRNGEALEHVATATAVVLDKTGTLTLGKPQIVSIHANGGAGEQDVLSLAAAVEAFSEHPLAQAVLDAARERQIALPKAEAFETVTGRGVRAQINGTTVTVGNRAFLEENGIHVGSARSNGNGTEIRVARDGQEIGALYVADPVRPTTRAALDSLRRMGIDIIMASGDREETARAVANELGIERVYAPVLPADKVKIVRDLQAQGKRVLFAGDGINDAPALAQADAGVAMATGTDIAMESADITLLRGDLTRLVEAIDLGRRTRAIIRQNLFWAFLYNTIGVPVAAGALYPAFGLLLSPVIASAAMSVSSLSVVMNSLRLRSGAAL
ncbi:MAG TPA: copper-translocating P-type ATPase [bacterium]|jgi:Cu+-exporting ATPase